MFFRQTKYISEQIRKSNIDIKRIKVEPYWNVNFNNKLKKALEANIKVEPYWNVNTSWIKELGINQEIKVEPYWNVNEEYFMCIGGAKEGLKQNHIGM